MRSHQSQPKGNRNRAITIAMPTGGSFAVSAADANHAVITASSVGGSSLSTHTEDNLYPLPPLPNIWACPKVTRGPPSVEKKGKSNGWRCGHCGECFYPDHATRAAHHLAQQPGGSIVICSAHIPEREKARCVFLCCCHFLLRISNPRRLASWSTGMLHSSNR